MDSTKSIGLKAAVFAGVLMAGSSAWAHHSFAMFDQAKRVPLTGVRRRRPSRR